MPAFRFEALDASGKSTSGLLEADTPRAARSQLRAQSLVDFPEASSASKRKAGIC